MLRDADQIKRYSQALGGAPTDFDEEFERRDRVREANYDRKRSL